MPTLIATALLWGAAIALAVAVMGAADWLLSRRRRSRGLAAWEPPVTPPQEW